MGKFKMKIRFLHPSFLSVMTHGNDMTFGAVQKAYEHLRLFFVIAGVYLSPNGLMQICRYLNSCLSRNILISFCFLSPRLKRFTSYLFLGCASTYKNIPQGLSVHYCFCGCGFYLFIIISVNYCFPME